MPEREAPFAPSPDRETGRGPVAGIGLNRDERLAANASRACRRPESASISSFGDLDLLLEEVAKPAQDMRVERFQSQILAPNHNLFQKPPHPSLSRSDIRTTYHLSAELRMDGKSVDEALVHATRTCLKWAKSRFPERLSEAAWRGESISQELGGHRLEIVAIPETGHWALRLNHPDAAFGDRKAVPGRSWTTELALARNTQSVHFAAQVRCATPRGISAPILHTRPRPIVELVKSMNVYAPPMRLTPYPLEIENAQHLELLRSLLVDANRELPVVVLTNPRASDKVLAPWVVNPEELASRLVGQAHVVLLPHELTYDWSDMVSKPWSVYQGAIRVYRPGLDMENQSDRTHPLTTLDRILATPPKEGMSPEATFQEDLIQDVGKILAESPKHSSGAIFVTEAQAKAAEVEREKIQAQLQAVPAVGVPEPNLHLQMELLKAQYEKELASIRQQLADAKRESEWLLDEASGLEQDRDRLLADNGNLKWQVANLREAIATGSPVREEPIPTTYDALPEWVERNLAGRLVLHPRAKRDLKDAEYKNVEQVYKALKILADDYQPMRAGQAGAKERYEKNLEDLKLHESGSIERGRAGSEGKEYFVKWPPGLKNEEKFVDRHLRNNGSSRDPRTCLGIYFFYDKEESQVVVCSLPRHLDNQYT